MPVEFIVPLVALVAVVGACLFATMQVKSIYNQLVVLKNLTSNSFSQISVQLKRRHDLIPNLVQCVKMYMGHENETLTAVIAARNTAASNLQNAKKNPTDTAALAKLAQSESSLGGALGRLSMVMEAYPELKADAATAKLTEELTSTENRICLLYTSPSPRDQRGSRMPSSA